MRKLYHVEIPLSIVFALSLHLLFLNACFLNLFLLSLWSRLGFRAQKSFRSRRAIVYGSFSLWINALFFQHMNVHMRIGEVNIVLLQGRHHGVHDVKIHRPIILVCAPAAGNVANVAVSELLYVNNRLHSLLVQHQLVLGQKSEQNRYPAKIISRFPSFSPRTLPA